MATGFEKVIFQSNLTERQCQECSNYCTITLSSHTSKIMLKILQVRLQQYLNSELTDDTTFVAESEEELKSLLMKVKEESEKTGLKLKVQKGRLWHPVPWPLLSFPNLLIY